MRKVARIAAALVSTTLAAAAGTNVCDTVPAASGKWTPPGVPHDICENIHNSHRCLQQIEPHALRTAPEGVRRENGVLRIDVPRGDAVVFEHDDEGERGPFYLYLGHMPSGHHLVFVQLYEGSRHVLVDDVTGARTEIGGRPIFAPGEDRLAAVSAGYFEEQLSIYLRTGETWMREWSANFGGVATVRLAWRSEERLAVCVHDHEAKEHVVREVVLGKDGWNWADPPASP